MKKSCKYFITFRRLRTFGRFGCFVLILALLPLLSLILKAQTGHWDRIYPKNSPPKIESFGFARLTEGKVLLFGGYDFNYHNDTWLFDYETNNWTKLNIKNPPPIRCCCSMLQISDGKILMFGGSLGTEPGYHDTWLFDAATMDWKEIKTKTVTFATVWSSVSLVNDNNIILYGGLGNDTLNGGPFTSVLNYTWVFDIKELMWKMYPPDNNLWPRPRSGAAMALLDTGKLLLFGGYGMGFLNDTWVFDLNKSNGKLWTKINRVDSIDNFKTQEMIHLYKNINLVIGGYEDSTYTKQATSWIYYGNKNTWKKLKVTNNPKNRGMAYPVAKLTNNKILLFGGITSQSFLNDTWILTIDSLPDGIEDNNINVDITPKCHFTSPNILNIDFNLNQPSNVELTLYDIKSSLIKQLNNSYCQEGSNSQSYNLSDIPFGVYFIRFNAGGEVKAVKVLKVE